MESFFVFISDRRTGGPDDHGLILLLNPDSLSALISTVLGWAMLLAGVGFLAAAVLNRFGTLSSVVGGLVCFSLGDGCCGTPWCWRRGLAGLRASC